MTLWRNFQRRVTSDILKISCQSQTKAEPNVASSHAFPARSVRRLRIIASDWFTLFPASDVTGQINNLCFGDVIGYVYTAPDEYLTAWKNLTGSRSHQTVHCSLFSLCLRVYWNFRAAKVVPCERNTKTHNFSTGRKFVLWRERRLRLSDTAV